MHTIAITCDVFAQCTISITCDVTQTHAVCNVANRTPSLTSLVMLHKRTPLPPSLVMLHNAQHDQFTLTHPLGFHPFPPQDGSTAVWTTGASSPTAHLPSAATPTAVAFKPSAENVLLTGGCLCLCVCVFVWLCDCVFV